MRGSEVRKILLTIASFFLAPVSLTYAHVYGEDYGMGQWMMHWGYNMGWFWPVIMMVFWIAVILGIIVLVRGAMLSSRKNEIKSEDTALEVLRKRYAMGEINKEEFEEKRKDLES